MKINRQLGMSAYYELQDSFDFNRTNFPIGPLTLSTINALFPNISTLKLTIKPENGPDKFLFTELIKFRCLRILHIIITEGLKKFSGPMLEIEELKLYFRTSALQEYLLLYILSKFSGIESLTISEGYFAYGALETLEPTIMKRLSIKNPNLTMFGTNHFKSSLYNYNLQYLKLIYSYIYDPESTNRFASIIAQYLRDLPHRELRELSFTLPLEGGIDYRQLPRILTEIRRIRIFILPHPTFENISHLHPFLLETSAKNIKVTFTYITLESDQNLAQGIAPHFHLLEKFKNLTIVQVSNPYVYYPYIRKKNCKNRSIYEYRQAEFERKNHVTARLFKAFVKEFDRNRSNDILFQVETESSNQGSIATMRSVNQCLPTSVVTPIPTQTPQALNFSIDSILSSNTDTTNSPVFDPDYQIKLSPIDLE